MRSLVLGQRGAREVAVGLARDQARRSRRPRAAPVASHSQWSALRTTSGCGSGTRPAYWMPSSCCSGSVDLAPERRLGPGPWRLRQVSSRSGTPDGDGRQLDLPVHGVGGQEDQRGAAVAGRLDGAAHRRRPVLVVAGEDQAPVAGGVDPAGVQVAGVGVGEVVAVALGPADEVVGVADVQRQARARVRAVEGDRGGGLLLAEQPALARPRRGRGWRRCGRPPGRGCTPAR